MYYFEGTQSILSGNRPKKGICSHCCVHCLIFLVFAENIITLTTLVSLWIKLGPNCEKTHRTIQNKETITVSTFFSSIKTKETLDGFLGALSFMTRGCKLVALRAKSH